MFCVKHYILVSTMAVKIVPTLLFAALVLLVPITATAQTSAATYLCINKDNGIKDKVITIYPLSSTVAVREFPGETFTAAAQFGADNIVRWVYFHRGVRVSGSVTYFLNVSTNTLYTHFSAVTMFGTKLVGNMQWFCRKLQ